MLPYWYIGFNNFWYIHLYISPRKYFAQKNYPFPLQETIDNHIFVERNCEFFIEAEDAQAGHIVEMELRYLTGRHVNDPVYACEKHKDSTDSRYSFCVLRLSSVQKEEDQYGHLSLKIPVPNLPAENGNFFTIPVMFRCWNSCSKDYGKNQELILKLRDLK